jgi:hypothetical protein
MMTETNLNLGLFVFSKPTVLHGLTVFQNLFPTKGTRVNRINEGKAMATLRATAVEIRKAIITHVSSTRNILPKEIYPLMVNDFPKNNVYEIRSIVKEMQKDATLIPDIIYGGLTLARN